MGGEGIHLRRPRPILGAIHVVPIPPALKLRVDAGQKGGETAEACNTTS